MIERPGDTLIVPRGKSHVLFVFRQNGFGKRLLRLRNHGLLHVLRRWTMFGVIDDNERQILLRIVQSLHRQDGLVNIVTSIVIGEINDCNLWCHSSARAVPERGLTRVRPRSDSYSCLSSFFRAIVRTSLLISRSRSSIFVK